MTDPLHFIIFRFCLFVGELAIFDLLFFFTMKKRKYWIIKSIITILLVMGITVGLCFGLNAIYQANHYDRNLASVLGAVMQLLIFVLLGVGFFYCFDVSLYELGSVLSLGYATRWTIFCLYSLVLNFANPSLFLIRINQQTPLNFVIYISVYIIFIIFSFIMIVKRKGNRQYTLELPAFVIAASVVILNTFLLSFAEVMSADHLLEYSFVLISNIITVSLIIVVNFYTQRQILLTLENELTNNLLSKQAEQYKFNKANAEMLHVKAHDLKHQVAILRKGGPEAEELLNELESVVYGYESVILTDNTVINVILSEKWQYCVKHKIKMTCSVDPKALSKMDTVHLYTMLGNILDNAIDAVMKIKEKEKRIISLKITYNHGVSILQCYNYFAEEIVFVDGLPQTNKEDSTSHGFGVKSIRNIVQQYGGEIDFDVDKDIFNLRITIMDN